MNPHHAGPLIMGPNGLNPNIPVADICKYGPILDRIYAQADMIGTIKKFTKLKEGIPGLLRGKCPKCKGNHLVVLPKREPARWNCDKCKIHGCSALEFLEDCIGMSRNKSVEYLAEMFSISLVPDPEPKKLEWWEEESKRPTKIDRFVLAYGILYEVEVKQGIKKRDTSYCHHIAKENTLYLRIRNRIIRYFLSRKSK